MTDFTDDYVNLLIKQYYDKPNASGEIAMKSESMETIKDVYSEFPERLDIGAPILTTIMGLSGGYVLGLSDDYLLGLSPEASVDLDLIGKIVGLSRNQPDRLSDTLYLQMLRVKIAKNNSSGFMVSDDKISIQDVINTAFDGAGLVTDNMDMSLSLYIDSEDVTPELINLIIYADLLPKPQGVRYDISANTSGEFAFGMSEEGEPDDDSILGFSELGYSPNGGGELAELYGS